MNMNTDPRQTSLLPHPRLLALLRQLNTIAIIIAKQQQQQQQQQ